MAPIKSEQQDGDNGAVLSNDAVDDTEALLSGAQSNDLIALHTAGMFYWCRYGALGADEGQRDLAAALQFFAPVYRQVPDSVGCGSSEVMHCEEL